MLPRSEPDDNHHVPAGPKPVIGLTGGMGSGKSLVAHQLESLGCGVIDADQLARQALEQVAVRQELCRWWGPTILGENGQVNRHAVAEIVFNDPQQLDRLEQLIHPLVHEGRQKLRRQYQQDAQWVAIVEDCPLLFEKNLDKQCDTIIFVDATEANRQQRLTKNRGWTMQEWTHREKNQMALDIKRQHADYIVDNNASEQACFDRVRFVLSQILKGPS